MKNRFLASQWALILGGSSGIGLATAQKLASEGMSVCIVHRDRKGSMERVEQGFDRIRALGGKCITVNVDALSVEGRQNVRRILEKEFTPEDKIQVLLHSIALGNLKPLRQLTEEDFQITLHSMGSSALHWVQMLLEAQLLAKDARIIGLTSEGNTFAMPYYAAIAAAKATLESLSRAMAMEFAPFGLRSNVIQPGIVDTPALRMIPGYEKMMDIAQKRNPYQRLTQPEDIANVVYLLCLKEALWINGALIHVDGGEHVGIL